MTTATSPAPAASPVTSATAPGTMLPTTMPTRRRLAVFDFDHTIVDDNTDTFVRDLLTRDQIPGAIRKLYTQDGWTAYMQGIFKLLHKFGYDECRIKERLLQIRPTDGMPELLRHLHSTGDTDTIIISDSNTYFIETWLAEQGLTDCVERVFSNPARFDADGVLRIEMFHLQTTCDLSTKNLCKGRIMDEYRARRQRQGVNYHWVVYAGDGTNDFCPMLRLESGDLACVRRGYKCEEIVLGTRPSPDSVFAQHQVRAETLFWDTGFEILNALKK